VASEPEAAEMLNYTCYMLDVSERPPAIDAEKVEQNLIALEAGTSTLSVCRTFRVQRSAIIDTLRRIGLTCPGSCHLEVDQTDNLS
jgi:hypothetical protein